MVQIKRLTVSNISWSVVEEISVLVKELNSPARKLNMVELARMMMQSHIGVFAAYVDGRIVGIGCISANEFPLHKKAFIEDVVVGSNFRKRDIGTRLVEEMKRFATEHECERIDFTCSRPASKAFWRSQGAEERSTHFVIDL